MGTLSLSHTHIGLPYGLNFRRAFRHFYMGVSPGECGSPEYSVVEPLSNLYMLF